MAGLIFVLPTGNQITSRRLPSSFKNLGKTVIIQPPYRWHINKSIDHLIAATSTAIKARRRNSAIFVDFSRFIIMIVFIGLDTLMSRSQFSVVLYGAFQLYDPAGRIVTPRMSKSQALLAYLALAPGRQVHRGKLQDLLWSDRPQKHGRDSLKKALAELRTCLTFGDRCALINDGGPVSLDPAMLVITPSQPLPGCPEGPEFLEGIDIRDSEFNIWLTSVRSEMHTPPALAVVPPAVASMADPLFEIGILPPEVDPQAPRGAIIAGVLLDDLIGLFHQSGVVRCYDLRHQRSEPPVGARSPDVCLRLCVGVMGHSVVTRYQLCHIASTQVVDSGHFNLPAPLSGTGEIGEVSTEICDSCICRLQHFDGFGSGEHRAARLVLAGLDRMFRLTNNDLEQAGIALDEAQELASSSSIFAWNAYLSAFRLEKSGAGSIAELQEKTAFLISHALELDHHNRLTIALVGHALAFVLKDIDRAAELLAPCQHDAHASPMLADTLSMLCLYTGRYREARRYAGIAVDLGRFNPFRYSFSTSLAMSALMLGDDDLAVRAGRAAVAQHIVRDGHLYEPALRTLAAAYARTDQLDAGRQLVDILGRQGGFDARRRLSRGEFASPDPQFRSCITSAIGRLYD